MKTPAQKYIRIMGFIIPVILMLVIFFNYFIDPFSVFLNGDISNKPAFETHERLAKPYIIRSIKPKTIILGTSRAEYGVNPEHPGFHEYPVYNLAVSAAYIYETFRYFQHANHIAPLKQVILAVDFLQFNGNGSVGSGYIEDRLAVDLKGKNLTYPLLDLLLILASLDALKASLNTISPFREMKGIFLENGQREHVHNEERIKKYGGSRKAFLSKDKNNITSTYYSNGSGYQFSYLDTKLDTFYYFRKILDSCYRDGIDLKLFISPSHARQWEAIAAVNLWDKWEYWKREMIKINEELAHQYGREAFSLWDFSGYNYYTTEQVPLLDDVETAMQWYWESSHYRNELGELVLDRIFNYQHSDRTLFEGFGVLITSDNIEQHLLNIRQDRQNYRLTHKEDILEIENLARKYLKKKAVLTQ